MLGSTGAPSSSPLGSMTRTAFLRYMLSMYTDAEGLAHDAGNPYDLVTRRLGPLVKLHGTP
jgi:hypothetical protein